MKGQNNIVDAVIAIFIIAIFATAIFPALSQATGQSTFLFQVVLGLLVLAIIVKFFQ